MYFSQATVIAFIAATAAAKGGLYEREAAYHDLAARNAMPDGDYNQLYARHAATEVQPKRFSRNGKTAKPSVDSMNSDIDSQGMPPLDANSPSSLDQMPDSASPARMASLNARDVDMNNPITGLWNRLKNGKSTDQEGRGRSNQARPETLEARGAEAQPGLGDCFGCGKSSTKDEDPTGEIPLDFSTPPFRPASKEPPRSAGKKAKVGGSSVVQARDLSDDYGLMERDFDLDERDFDSDDLYARDLEHDEMLARRDYEDEMLARREYEDLQARDYEPMQRRGVKPGRSKTLLPEAYPSEPSGPYDMDSAPDSGFGGSAAGSLGGAGGSFGGAGGSFGGASGNSRGPAKGLAARDYDNWLERRWESDLMERDLEDNDLYARDELDARSTGSIWGKLDRRDNDFWARQSDNGGDPSVGGAAGTGDPSGGADGAGGMEGAAGGMGGAPGGMGGAAAGGMSGNNRQESQDQGHRHHRGFHPFRWMGRQFRGGRNRNGDSSRQRRDVDSLYQRDLLEFQRRELGNQRRSYDDFEEGLAARDYEEELAARDYEEELAARDYEDLEARDYEDPGMFY